MQPLVMMSETSWPAAHPNVTIDQQVWQDLASRVAQTWLAQPHSEVALRSLSKPSTSERDLLTKTLAQLRSHDAETRQVALSALEEAEEWNASVVSAVTDLVADDPSASIRRRACELLAQEALRGSSLAAVALVSGLQDRLPCVREAALDGLTCLAAYSTARSADAAAASLQRLDCGQRYRGDELGLALAAMQSRGE